MSKVKTELGIPKRKLARSLRRTESAAKKSERIRKAKNNEYAWQTGYYVKNTRKVGEYVAVVVPERKEWKTHIEHYKEPAYDEKGKMYYRDRYVSVNDELVTIPEHVRRVHVATRFEEIPDRPVRISTGKKELRTRAARKLRRNRKFSSYKGALYKRDYDILWELF